MMSFLKTELFLQCFSDQSWGELCLHINSIVFLGTYSRSIFRELFTYLTKVENDEKTGKGSINS